MGLEMKAMRWVALGLVLAVMPFRAEAEDAKQIPKASPVGIGTDWNADVTVAPSIVGKTFSEAQVSVINRVNAYFNKINNLRGSFVQTAADDRRAKGKFFVKRPGRFRFVYSPPSKLVILSDGRTLLIEDHDLNTVDRFPIESTPFRLLLKENVDIVRDAHVTNIEETEEQISLSINDKKSDSSGKIQLYFNKQPELELREWIITDAQGLNTRIAIAGLNKEEGIDNKLFVGSMIDMPDFSNSD